MTVRPCDDLPARPHRAAALAGHEAVARGLTYVFGRAACPDCAGEFAVSEQIEPGY
ncbi:hypothetical protein [Streptomyces sp. NBC_00091]|uniref:hypothetical protein n=1 Tax=Streptomyces sp. NBC_00091 TaxID=2975648 RepID=UPI00224E2E88|nr:hypothetical protein [Streptomyces sp. NBC_00091]MCX5380492.1 hypothetical protein [Streptomyces sp. NBC_00091]